MLKYAGIGSRETPENILNFMTKIAADLSKEGWLMRSGHAIGADQAFERGQVQLDGYEIHLPFENYNNAHSHQHGFILPRATSDVVEIARQHHPAWDRLSPAVKLLMCRNVTIMLGANLDDPVDMVVCWTPFGRTTGGTGQALRIASTRGIPVFNLANDADFHPLFDFANRQTEAVRNATAE